MNYTVHGQETSFPTSGIPHLNPSMRVATFANKQRPRSQLQICYNSACFQPQDALIARHPHRGLRSPAST